MKTVLFSLEGQPPLTLKDLIKKGQEFFGETIADARSPEISKCLYSAIGLKYIIGLNQFSKDILQQKQVCESSETIQSILTRYTSSEVKDIAQDDLINLKTALDKLPQMTVTKENTTDKNTLAFNIVAELIMNLRSAIPNLDQQNKKRNSYKS